MDTVQISRELLTRVKAALAAGEGHCWQSARKAYFEGGQKQYAAEAMACQQAIRDLNDAEEDHRIRETFVKEFGGPNPYYKCKLCGEIEPGLREYLLAHVRKHEDKNDER